jgi:hypothetical protein
MNYKLPKPTHEEQDSDLVTAYDTNTGQGAVVELVDLPKDIEEEIRFRRERRKNERR